MYIFCLNIYYNNLKKCRRGLEKMRKCRQRTAGVLTAVMALMLALAVVFSLAPVSTASAARGGDENWVTIDELYDDSTQSFDSTKLMDLIEALTKNRSYNDLEKAAKDAITSEPSETFFKTSADFRKANDGKNVSVRFGGMKWDAVYLTTAKQAGANTQEGDIILDLWRSSDTLTAGDAATYSDFWSDKSTDKEYPSNMYSTSKIRVETLNAGGQYTQINTRTQTVELTEHRQDSGNKYARFTMENAPNSLTQYLAKPSEVGYQATEYDEGTMTSFYGPKEYGGFPTYPTDVKYYYFPNDAYGTLSGGDWYEKMDYSTKGSGETAYDAWKDDYLWLPSLTETGMSNGSVSGEGDGMWDTDASLRSAKSGLGKNYCWLRSGSAYRADQAYLLDDSGNRNQLVVNNDGCGVRPALHFNLSAAMRSAKPDKDRWTGDTKPYSPDGVTWKIENTDVVEIAAVANGEGTSWYDEAKHTITAKKVGEYKIQVRPATGFRWKGGGNDAITVTYTVEPADMTVTFNNEKPGAFNNGRLERTREFVYSLGMDPIALKLPDPTDPKFPINWKNVTWYKDTISKLKIQYIVQKYEETEYSEATIKNHLDGLKSSADWKDYENLGDDRTAQAPKYYVVYFKATDTEGNHNPCYDYFVVHIAVEELTITLSEAAKAGFAKGVEYGDVAHAKDAFEKDILGGIQTVIGKLNTDKTRDFKNNISDYKFYLRKDNSIQEGIVQDDGDIYTVENDGIHLQNGSQKVENLPLGTYHLYVDAADQNTSNYLTFAWAGERPSFEVKARKINVTLTFEQGATYGQPHTGWVTATASRAGGAEGSWYAQNEAKSDDDLAILGLSYTLQGMSGVPSISTPAGTYPVTPTRSNANYDVEYVDEHGGTAFEYTIARATLTVTAKDKTITYGDEPSNDGITYNGFVNEEKESVLSGELAFDYGSYAAYEDVGDYVITPSGLSSGNYTIVYKEGTLTVTPKEIVAKWSEKRYTYTGEQFTELPTATADGIGEDGTFTLLVALSNSAQTFMNAGAYAFKATLDSANPKAKNYTLNENTKARAYIIEKQTVTAPAVASKVYNGATQKADIDDSVLYRVSENGGGLNAGDYPVKLTLKDANNYKWATSDEAEIVLTFSITKAVYNMAGVTFEDITVTYNGEAHSITIAGELPNGVTVDYEGNGQKAVGKYTVTATFKGDEQNYEPIPAKQATLTILEGGRGLQGITFEGETVTYDGEPHSIFIKGTPAQGISVTYENNGQTQPGTYSVTATFADSAGTFAKMTATLTILSVNLEFKDENGNTTLIIDSADGFDPSLKLTGDGVDKITRTFLAWEQDEISHTYTVKLMKDGEEIPFNGKATVRLLIPEEWRDKDFTLQSAGNAAVEYTRDGDYVVFEADGLSAYVFTCGSVPYYPILFITTGVLLVGVAALVVWRSIIKKKKIGESKDVVLK